MDCERTIQAHAYHDDRLSPAERVAFEAHLAQCPQCAREVAGLAALSRMIASAPLPAGSDDGRDHYYRAWDAVAQQRGLLRISGWLTAAAAAVLIGSLSLLPGETPEGQQQVIVNPGPSTWEVAAFMPPPERATDRPDEFIELAQWMAEDLSIDGGGIR